MVAVWDATSDNLVEILACLSGEGLDCVSDIKLPGDGWDGPQHLMTLICSPKKMKGRHRNESPPESPSVSPQR